MGLGFRGGLAAPNPQNLDPIIVVYTYDASRVLIWATNWKLWAGGGPKFKVPLAHEQTQTTERSCLKSSIEIQAFLGGRRMQLELRESKNTSHWARQQVLRYWGRCG